MFDGQEMAGGVESMKTLNVQVAVLSALSIAVQRTTETPSGNDEPDV